METLLPHPSLSEDGQNAWNQNYTYIFEVISINKPNINDAEVNTSNLRVGFSEKTTDYAVCGTGSKQGKTK